MSFSSTVKDEVCKIETSRKCCVLSELTAAIRISCNDGTGCKTKLNVVKTEHEAFARRFISMIQKTFGVSPKLSIRKSNKLRKNIIYAVTINNSLNDDLLLDIIKNEKLPKKTCCKKSYLRGAFLAAGSIANPQKIYHVEITCHDLNMALSLVRLLGDFKLNGRIAKRKNSFIVYLKEGENIVDFLNVIGAHKALMDLENVRILKEMRNSVNRIVNCETANLGKTVNASLRQIENIIYIRDNIGFDKLPAHLREIAEIRLKHTDASLKELGEILNPPIGKSGVNHRLNKLDKIAEEGRKLRQLSNSDNT